MSKFNGITFKVVPENGEFYPIIERDNNGIYRWNGECFVQGQTNLDTLRESISIVTVKRPLGTLGTVVHIEAGLRQSKSLTVPKKSGGSKTVSAILVSLNNVRAYGKPTGGGTLDQQFLCDMEFVVVSDPTG